MLEKRGKKIIVSGDEMKVIDTNEAGEHSGDVRSAAESA
jgi:hypothetical protein